MITLHFIFNRSTNINYFIYTSHQNSACINKSNKDRRTSVSPTTLRSSFRVKALENNKDKHTKKLPKTGALVLRVKSLVTPILPYCYKPGPSQCCYYRYFSSTDKNGLVQKRAKNHMEETPSVYLYFIDLLIDMSELSLQFGLFRVNSMPRFGSTSFIWRFFLGVVLPACGYLKPTRVMKRKKILATKNKL